MRLTPDQWTMLARCERAAIVEPGGVKVTTEHAQAVIRACAPNVAPRRIHAALERLVALALATCTGNRYRSTARGRAMLVERFAIEAKGAQ